MNKGMSAAFVAALAASSVAASASAATSAQSACKGVTACKVVATVDVDGDGKRDQVGIGTKRVGTKGILGSETRTTMRVRTAKGHTLTWSYETWMSGTPKPFYRAAKFDGRAGNEIILDTQAGGNSSTYRVVTYRDGQLRTLKGPGGMSDWWTQNTAMGKVGWHRSTSGGKVYFTRKSASSSNGKTYTVQSNKYRWSTQGWTRMSPEQTSKASARQVQHLGGLRLS